MPPLWWGAAAASLGYLAIVTLGGTGWIKAVKVLPALLLAAAVAPVSTLAAAGMVASAAGDAFLLDKSRFLLHGLGAFLVGHVCFAAAFLSAAQAGPSPAVVAGLLLYGAVALAVVRPRSGTMRLAVPVYALALCTMAATASTLGPLGVAGGLSFVASDSLLAVHQFKRPVPGRDVLVASTYYGALLALSAAILAA